MSGLCVRLSGMFLVAVWNFGGGVCFYLIGVFGFVFIFFFLLHSLFALVLKFSSCHHGRAFCVFSKSAKLPKAEHGGQDMRLFPQMPNMFKILGSTGLMESERAVPEKCRLGPPAGV